MRIQLRGADGVVGWDWCNPQLAEIRAAGPNEAGIVELQRQMHELHSDLLDEREKRIVRWQETNGTVLVVLGFVMCIGEIWPMQSSGS